MGAFILLVSIIQTSAQIVTKIVSAEAIKNVNHYTMFAKAELISMPYFDKQLLLEEDKIRDGMRVPYRFGKEFKTSLCLEKNGTWYDLEKGDKLWALRIRSEGAISINLIFDRYRLADGAEVFLYNIDNGVIHGPYTSDHNNPTLFLGTGLVKGDEVIVVLKEPKKVTGQSELRIGKIIHAYRDIINVNEKSSGFVDINCPQGAGWEKESDAVVRIVIGGGSCSGILINNRNNDSTPYILTAFHCATNQYPGPNYELTPEEKLAVGAWVYQFQYRKIECNGTTVYQNRNYTSEGFRAAWSHTDFALVEMKKMPTHSGVTYAGWSRSVGNINSTISIHHPVGNPQKISIDNEPPVFGTHLDFPPDHFWNVNWDVGTTLVGSSGSPLLNNNKQVIGQLSYGSGVIDDYGRFDLSWYGPTPFDPEKSLKNWLDPNNQNPMSINSICNVPPRADIVGPDLMCANQQVSFKLNKGPLGREITWTTSPSNLLNPSTYSGDTIYTTQVLSNSSGSVTITASFYDYCGSVQKSYSKVVWIGKPTQPVIHVPQEPVNCNYNAMFWASSNPSGSTYTWQVTNGSIISQSNGEILVKPNCPPPNWTKPWNLMLQVSASNSCGSTSLTTRNVSVLNYGGPNPRLIIAPNPASVEITISEVEPPNDNIPWVLRLMSQQGAVLVNVTTTLPRTLNVQGLQPGMYVLHARREQYYEQQIVIIE